MTTAERAPYPARYASLDAWRGVACFLVLVHHVRLPAVQDALWLGVQLFFVISGYCIAAATDRAIEVGLKPRTFFLRRVRRIFPPYVASLALALVADALTGLRHGWPIFSGGGVLVRPLRMYVENATMMQWIEVPWGLALGTRTLTTAPQENPVYFLPVYWSLCYEEQFYAFMGLALVGASFLRARWSIVGFTAIVIAIECWCPGIVTGLLVDYWLEFACGIALHWRLCKVRRRDHARLADVALVLAFVWLAASAAVRGQFAFRPDRLQLYSQLALCLGFALVLLALRPFDERIVRSWPGRILRALGAFSYSLYLVQLCFVFPLSFVRGPISERTFAHAGDLFVGAVAIGGSWLFYRAFERPFLNAPLAAPSEPPAIAAVGAA